MRLKLFFFFLFLIFLMSAPAKVAATSQQAYQDYLFQYDQYRQKNSAFKVARSEWLKFRSLASETDALAKAREVLAQRDQLLRAYLLYLNERLLEEPALSVSDRQFYQSLIQNEITFLEKHSQLVPSVGSLDDAEDVSKELESHYEVLYAAMRQIATGISIGRLYGIRQEYDELTTQAESLSNQASAEFSQEKQNVINRWLLQIRNKRTLYQQKINTVLQLVAQLSGRDVDDIERDALKIEQDIGEAHQYLREGTAFFTEFLNVVRVQ